MSGPDNHSRVSLSVRDGADTVAAMTTALVRPAAQLRAILDGQVDSFALVRRAGAPGVAVLTGTGVTVERLRDIPLPPVDGSDQADLLVLMPYRQLTEKGYACVDDATPM